MARDGAVSCLRESERIDGVGGGLESSPSDSDEVHVLAVDDSLIDRKVIERLLRITACKVTAVDSGRRALQFLGLDEEKAATAGFDGLKVDLIITDYCMPGMTGYELLKKIKESSSFREIPVVIMSSENVLARIDRCLEEGAEDFLLKPVKLADVKRLRNYMFRNIGIVNGNKRKLRNDPIPRHLSSPPSSSQSTSPPSRSPSQTPSPPSVSSLTSPETSDSSRPRSPAAEMSSSLPLSQAETLSSSPVFPASSPAVLPSPVSSSPLMDSPTRRQRMTSPGLD